jgi:hypothetical protein
LSLAARHSSLHLSQSSVWFWFRAGASGAGEFGECQNQNVCATARLEPFMLCVAVLCLASSLPSLLRSSLLSSSAHVGGRCRRCVLLPSAWLSDRERRHAPSVLQLIKGSLSQFKEVSPLFP